MLCAVTSHDNVASTFPAGWTIYQQANNGATMRATLAWKRAAASEAAFTVTHAAGAGIIGSCSLYRNAVTSGSPVDVSSLQGNAASTTCTAAGVTSTVDEALVIFTMHAPGGRLSSAQTSVNLGAMTERFDRLTGLGTGACVSGATVTETTAGATGDSTGTLSGAAIVNIGCLTVIKGAFGVTQPGGAGTTIYLYSNTASANGTNFTFAEIATAFPSDFVDSGSPSGVYRSKVTVQVGDDGTGTKATSLIATKNTVEWDTGATLAFRHSGSTNWTFNLGTTLLATDGFNGCNLTFGAATTIEAASPLIYGSRIVCRDGLVTFTDSIGGTQSALVDCILENMGTSATSGFSVGSSLLGWNLAYNVNMSVATTTGPALTSFVCSSIQTAKITVMGNPTVFLDIASGDTTTVDDIRFIGTPSVANVRSADSVNLHALGHPQFATGIIFKFTVQSPGDASHHVELWKYDVMVVDRTGTPIAGIPVTLTDSTSVVQVNTTTDSTGRISFSYQFLPNGVLVREHYSDAGLNYLVRELSPFTLTVNSSSSASYNPVYLSRTRRFYWPGVQGGTFSDVLDVVQLQEPITSGTNWSECSLA